jgi:hypothetical protein
MGSETSPRGGSETPPRPPTLTDLARIGAELNRLGARYVVVGGLAMIQAGLFRTTEDIDLLIEVTLENEARVIEALLILPDQAIRELKPGEIGRYGVVRVGDEVLVDLMKSGCGVSYHDAVKDALTFNIEGIPIPFASPQTLWRMKQTVRAKDIPDRLYLRQLLEAQGLLVEPAASSCVDIMITRWWNRLKSWWHDSRSAKIKSKRL